MHSSPWMEPPIIFQGQKSVQSFSPMGFEHIQSATELYKQVRQASSNLLCTKCGHAFKGYIVKIMVSESGTCICYMDKDILRILQSVFSCNIVIWTAMYL